MGLTDAEKAAGRAFRDAAATAWNARLAAEAPTYEVPTVISQFRHTCPARAGRSTALPLVEIYQTSPAHGDVPAGRFAYITQAGRCRACGQSALSATGRLVDAQTRPPLHGRAARNRYGTGPAPPPERPAMTHDYTDPATGAPEKEPAQQESIPGHVYDNPNEDETYVPPDEADAADEADQANRASEPDGFDLDNDTVDSGRGRVSP